MVEIPKCGICGVTGGCPCHPGMVYPEPATLTCSEVVERLRNCPTSKRTGVGDCGEDMRINGVHHSCKLADDHEGAHECDCSPDSWRERRVQELEETLREAAGRFYLCAKRLRESRSEGWASDADNWGDSLADKADALKDEWREQIRKGAKHE